MQSKTFIQNFEDVYVGEPWFGESISAKLIDITEEIAFRQPQPGVHSIAEILNHMDFWNKGLLYKLKMDTSLSFTMAHPDNWPSLETLKKKSWKAIRQSYDQNHRKLFQELQKRKELAEDIESHLLGLIEHEIYHHGQIVIVKKLVKPPSPM